MSEFWVIAGLIVLGMAMLISVVVLVSMSAWHVIYYLIGCRRAPVQKTAVTVFLSVWAIVGMIAGLMP